MNDVFARRIVGWRVAVSMKTDFVLDALNQALHDRAQLPGSSITAIAGRHISTFGTPNIRGTLALNHQSELGDSYDNAMAETINGL
ncbi:integrase catalytic region [Caballeronia concitans]|uniref:Integrase catalytic region n=1 Tax=Caballeronia concitans TaxID=1777133 RepID=A0A658R512_9BURK|nr:integrase catalytic region [Caballeronia concitans]